MMVVGDDSHKINRLGSVLLTYLDRWIRAATKKKEEGNYLLGLFYDLK